MKILNKNYILVKSKHHDCDQCAFKKDCSNNNGKVTDALDSLPDKDKCIKDATYRHYEEVKD